MVVLLKLNTIILIIMEKKLSYKNTKMNINIFFLKISTI